MSVKLASVERFLRVGRNDEAHLAFEIDADLTSVFSWNTKQLFVWVAAEYTTPHNPGGSSVSVWDRTVENKADAHLKLPFVRNKYKLVDDGTGLRGNSVNLTMGWQIMPRVGVMMKGTHDVPTRVHAAGGVPGATAAAGEADGGVHAAAQTPRNRRTTVSPSISIIVCGQKVIIKSLRSNPASSTPLVLLTRWSAPPTARPGPCARPVAR